MHTDVVVSRLLILGADINIIALCVISYQPGMRKAGARLVLRLLYIPTSVCVFVHNYHVRYVMSFRYYATIATSAV